MKTRTCKWCQIEKPLTSEYYQPRKNNNWNTPCIMCSGLYSQILKRYKGKTHPVKLTIAASQKRWEYMQQGINGYEQKG